MSVEIVAKCAECGSLLDVSTSKTKTAAEAREIILEVSVCQDCLECERESGTEKAADLENKIQTLKDEVRDLKHQADSAARQQELAEMRNRRNEG